MDISRNGGMTCLFVCVVSWHGKRGSKIPLHEFLLSIPRRRNLPPPRRDFPDVFEHADHRFFHHVIRRSRSSACTEGASLRLLPASSLFPPPFHGLFFSRHFDPLPASFLGPYPRPLRLDFRVQMSLLLGRIAPIEPEPFGFPSLSNPNPSVPPQPPHVCICHAEGASASSFASVEGGRAKAIPSSCTAPPWRWIDVVTAAIGARARGRGGSTR